MAVGINALITVVELQTYPGIPAAPTAAQTASLEALIDGVSATFDKYCQNDLVQRSASEDYLWSEIIAAGGSGLSLNRLVVPKLELRRYPVVSVTSITDPAANTIAATEYWIDKLRGYLMRTGSWNAPVDANNFVTYWTIVYVAGRFATTAAVDADVKLACKEQVAHVWGLPDESASSTAVGDLKIAYDTAREKGGSYQLLDSVKGRLSSYVKRSV